jgi:hypothetical protein
MFLPISRCTSALICFCLMAGLCTWFVIRLCGSTVDVVPFLPKNKKKIALLSSLVVVTIGVVTSTMSVNLHRQNFYLEWTMLDDGRYSQC